MASLSQTYASENSVTIRCSGMDSSHAQTRYFWWQIYRNGSLVDEFGNTSPPYASSNSASFYGLDSGVSNYSVLCGIYGDSSYSQEFTTLRLYGVYTNAAHVNPDISWFSVSQNGRGSKSAICSWSAYDVEQGATYAIFARKTGTSGWYMKDSGDASGSGSCEITFDDYTTYDVMLRIVNATGFLDSYETSVTLVAADFAWTYPKRSGYSFNLTADEWEGLWNAIVLRLGRNYTHKKAAAGDQFTAAMYNQAVSAIGRGTYVSKGDIVTAELMNELVTNVNRM